MGQKEQPIKDPRPCSRRDLEATVAGAEGTRQGGQRALKAIAKILASTLSERRQPVEGFKNTFLAPTEKSMEGEGQAERRRH